MHQEIKDEILKPYFDQASQSSAKFRNEIVEKTTQIIESLKNKQD